MSEFVSRATPADSNASSSSTEILRARHGVRIALLALVILGLLIRAAGYFHNPKPFSGGGLAVAQAEMARNIVHHGRWFVINREATDLITHKQNQEHRLIDFSRVDFSHVDRVSRAEPAVDQMPGLSVVLAGLWWITGTETYTVLQWLQIILDTCMVLLIYWIAWRLTESVLASLLSALLYALSPIAFVVDPRPVLDTWAIFFTIASVAAFLWARERAASPLRLISLGLITGIGLYFRPFILFLPFALALVATPGGGWRRRLLWMAAPTAVALLVLAPWTVRNYYEFNRFIPTRTGLGQAVFQGAGLARGDKNSAKYVHEHAKGASYGSPNYDGFLWGATVRDIADHPGPYLRKVGHRARFLLPCLLVLIVWRRWRDRALVPVAVAAATIIPYLLIGDDTKFYLPAAFAYFILLAMVVAVMVAPAGVVTNRASSYIRRTRRSF